MIFVIALFFCIIFLVVKNKCHDVLSRRMAYLFILLWAASAFLSVTHYGGLLPVSANTYVLVMLNVAFFLVGYISCRKETVSTEWDQYKVEHSILLISSNWLFKLILIVLSVYIYTLVVTFLDYILFYNTMADIRAEDSEGLMSMYGSMYKTLKLWVVTPFSVVAMPVFAYHAAYKRNWVFYLLLFFFIGSNLLTAGRFGYVRILVGFYFILFCVFNFIKNKKRAVFLSAIVVGCFFYLMLFITNARMNSLGTDVTSSYNETRDQVATYIGGPITALDHAVNKGNYLNRIGGYQLGGLTFTTIQQATYPVVRPWFGKYTLSTEKITFKQEEYIDVGPMKYNALYSCIFWFYFDFGYLGAIIFPFLFGYLLRHFIWKLRNTGSFVWLVMVSWIFQKVMHSVFDYSFNTISEFVFGITILLLGIYLDRNKNRIKINV